MVRSGCNLECPDIMKSDESALQVRGLTKRFDRLAVDALDLTIRTGSYQVIFNAFKRIAAPYSEIEKTALFSKTATDFYRLKLG